MGLDPVLAGEPGEERVVPVAAQEARRADHLLATVHRPEEAVADFLGSEMDCVFLGSLLCEKSAVGSEA